MTALFLPKTARPSGPAIIQFELLMQLEGPRSA